MVKGDNSLSSGKCSNHQVKLFWAAALNAIIKLFHFAKHSTDQYYFRKPANMKDYNFPAQI